MPVQHRSKSFYSRLKVPPQLRAIVGKSEIVRSLRTTRIREARLRAAVWEARITTLFLNIRFGWIKMSKDTIQRILQSYHDSQIEAFEEQLTAGFRTEG